MKQVLQNIKDGKLSVTDCPAPVAQTGQVVIANSASLISAGTGKMVMIIRWFSGGFPEKRCKSLNAVFLRLPSVPTIVFHRQCVLKFHFLRCRAGFYDCEMRVMYEMNIQAGMFGLGTVKY